jgi:hypothetical protein
MSKKPIKIQVMAEVGAGVFWDDEGATTLDTHFEMSPELLELDEKFYQWNNEYVDGVYPLAEPCYTFDWEKWHNSGIELCRKLKAILGDQIILYFVFGYEDPKRFGQLDTIHIENR